MLTLLIWLAVIPFALAGLFCVAVLISIFSGWLRDDEDDGDRGEGATTDSGHMGYPPA